MVTNNKQQASGNRSLLCFMNMLIGACSALCV
jgi:hypothetical protein